MKRPRTSIKEDSVARPTTDELTIVHVVFVGQHLSGREVLIANLAQAQSSRLSSWVRVVVIGSATYPTYLGDRGVDVAMAVPGRGLGAWLRALRHLLRAGPRSRPVDVLHAHGPLALLLVATVRLLGGGRRAGAAIVYTNHGFVETVPGRRLLLRTELFCYRWIDRVVVCSPHQLARLAPLAGRPVDLVLNGVAAGRSTSTPQRVKARAWFGLPGDAAVIGMVARLAPEKRHDIFLDVGASILATCPDAFLLIAGDGPRRAEIQTMIEARRLTGRVRLVGHVHDVSEVYSALDVLLHTSDTEGTPLAVLEAMAAGVPVVATAVGGTPALISDGTHGLLVPPRRPDLLIQAVLRVLDDHQLRDTMVRSARERVLKHLSLTRMCAELDGVYAAAMELSRPVDALC
jgi:glycosyltransferase involved in cell wall biosynthesis